MSLDQLAEQHLRTMLHGFVDWGDEEFGAHVNAHGGPVKYHEHDHVKLAGEFTDPDMPEHQHTHAADDPLRTWDGVS